LAGVRKDVTSYPNFAGLITLYQAALAALQGEPVKD
jgi:hypothetical protein